MTNIADLEEWGDGGAPWEQPTDMTQQETSILNGQYDTLFKHEIGQIITELRRGMEIACEDKSAERRGIERAAAWWVSLLSTGGLRVIDVDQMVKNMRRDLLGEN